RRASARTEKGKIQICSPCRWGTGVAGHLVEKGGVGQAPGGPLPQAVTISSPSSAKPGDSTIKPRIPFIRRRFTSIQTSPSLPANLFPRQTPPHTQNAVLVLLLRHQPARRPAGHGAPRVPPTNASTAPPHAPAPPASPGRLDRRRLRRAASRLFLPLVRPAHPHELGRGLRAGRPQLQLHAAAPGGARRVARRQAPRRRSQAQLLCRCRLVAGCWLGRCGCSPCCSGLEEEQL
ncbi:hypothetical protein IWX48DRAFT_681845, partial [Phyllosticta citricarpa]